MNKLVIMISGKMGSGKTSLSNRLYKHFSENTFNVTERMKFADIIYEMHDAVKFVARKYNVPFNPKESTLLQFLGTDLFRSKDPDVWVKAVRNRVIETTSNIILNDDLRFKNEFYALSNTPDTQVITVRLEADKDSRKARCDAWRDNDTHQSEVDLDDWVNKFDLVINTGANGLNSEETLNVVIEYINKESLNA